MFFFYFIFLLYLYRLISIGQPLLLAMVPCCGPVLPFVLSHFYSFFLLDFSFLKRLQQPRWVCMAMYISQKGMKKIIFLSMLLFFYLAPFLVCSHSSKSKGTRARGCSSAGQQQLGIRDRHG